MKKYTKPEVDITLFHTEDIITSSGIGGDYTKVGTADELKFPYIWPDADF